ncbi:MAG TPA: hypothetical protein VEB42_10000, partial [Chitinophagaceae bacterium]|nr:hypothetical protein [Chitinophagaceae bacterium]
FRHCFNDNPAPAPAKPKAASVIDHYCSAVLMAVADGSPFHAFCLISKVSPGKNLVLVRFSCSPAIVMAR